MDRLRLLVIDQEAVVLDIGSKYSKVGYSNEITPRFIIPTPPELYKSEDLDQALPVMQDFLRVVYFHKLQWKPKEGATILAENLLTPRHIVVATLSVLFKEFQVPYVFSVAAISLPLYTTGLYTGIVMDVGYANAQIMPIYEGFPVMKSYRSLQAWSQAISQALILAHDNFVEDQCEEIKAKVLFIPYGELAKSLADGIPDKSYTIKQTNSSEDFDITLADRVCPAKWLFGNVDDEEPNLALDLLQSVSQLNVSMRKEVIQNIVVSGGTTMLPGFLPRLEQETAALIDSEFPNLTALKEFFHFTSSIYPRNLLTWIGGSIVGQLHALERFGLSREDFLEKGAGDRFAEEYIYISPGYQVSNSENQMGCGSAKSSNATPAYKQNSALLKQVREAKEKTLPNRQDTSGLQINKNAFVSQKLENITDVYRIGKVIGEGAFGSVALCIHKISGDKRAIKTINKSRSTQGQEENDKFLNEVKLLSQMDHPNIIRTYEFFEDKRYYHMVSELWTGGELFDYIVENKKFNEGMAAQIMFQVISAISHCHERNVVHRDLKPENLLLASKPGPNAKSFVVKVIDFGTSWLFEPESRLNAKYGTPYYIAPEVLDRKYDERWDVWSAGVILYILLSGQPPFNGKSDVEILKAVRKHKLRFPDREWRTVSKDARDLISRMLSPQDNRPHASEVLLHPWITSNQKAIKVNQSIANDTINNLKNFRADRKLQQAVLAFMTSQLIQQSDISELQTTFRSFDLNGDGKLSRSELFEGYCQVNGPRAAEQEVERIMESCDLDGSGFIDYSEFIQAAIDKQKILSKKNLQTAFNAFDQDGSGSISVDEIKAVLGSMNQGTDDVWEKVIAEVDQDGNGEIDIKEFKEMMLRLF